MDVATVEAPPAAPKPAISKSAQPAADAVACCQHSPSSGATEWQIELPSAAYKPRELDAAAASCRQQSPSYNEAEDRDEAPPAAAATGARRRRSRNKPNRFRLQSPL